MCPIYSISTEKAVKSEGTVFSAEVLTGALKMQRKAQIARFQDY